MSKYLILGDLHCRSIWKDIVAKEGDNCDKIIFLGDYTVPREAIFDDVSDACGFLYEVLDYKDKNPDKVILLRGNHDCQSLGYRWAKCYPQDYPSVRKYWQTEDVSNWFLKNSQWIYQIPDTNIVCSHAGISEAFLKSCEEWLVKNSGSQYDDGTIDPEMVLSLINTIPPNPLFGFTPCKLSDYSGESATQPCTWIRPHTLSEYGVKEITHVIGHTIGTHVVNCKDDEDYPKDGPDIWCCDCLKYGEYLVIENGKFIPKKFNDESKSSK